VVAAAPAAPVAPVSFEPSLIVVNFNKERLVSAQPRQFTFFQVTLVVEHPPHDDDAMVETDRQRERN